jgi:hypothetical protein
MDKLFLIPSSPVAMPRAYWLDQPFLSSQLVLLQPSQFEWHQIQEFMTRDDPSFDIDILNSIYKHSAIVLPHRQYNLLSAEEQTIIQYILNLDSRGFAPGLCEVADMANKLLGVRGGKPVGKNWATRFVTRPNALKMAFN